MNARPYVLTSTAPDSSVASWRTLAFASAAFHAVPSSAIGRFWNGSAARVSFQCSPMLGVGTSER